ncbi:MAG TPA: pyruvate ferredoxin oxidoreductase, partial [Firmicutes bacterium]|nr:pyruvate ferredoxin oxidoreductase [Bacillota bacterium]
HSALAICVGAAAAGARTFSATSSQGLAYMHEVLHWASGGRFPMVLVNVNRALGAPWSLEPDQGDSLNQRDTGWIQLYCSSAQEVFDFVLLGYALSEQLLLPCLVSYDGFYISHSCEAVEVAIREQAADFLGPKALPAQLEELGRAYNLHSITGAAELSKLIRERHRDMQQAISVFTELNCRFQEIFGRSYSPVQAVGLPEAGMAVVTAGACAETVYSMLPDLNSLDLSVGAAAIKMFRPFPRDELCKWLKNGRVKRVMVVDRNCSPGAGGIFTQEVRAALSGLENKPSVHSLMLAGGVDLTPAMLEQALRQLGQDFREEIWGVDL